MPDPQTRARLLDAAWFVANTAGVPSLTLSAVGARAGVSRQAVYLHFRNRATLLLEMAKRADRTSGFTRRLAATRKLPSRHAFRRMLEEWFAYVPSILSTHLALEAAAMTGSDGGEAYLDRMADWRQGIRVAVARLAEDRHLSSRWDVDGATDWVWAHVHPTTYHHLVDERGWAPDDVAARTIDALERELLL